ncbi:bacteriohemerythrin [Campylobacter jejuni]|nr:bacteriohemerythrin [Campylobacter jejuni]
METKLIPNWHSEYSINNELLDKQHKEIFNIAKKLEANIYRHTNKDELKIIIKELFFYIKTHFKDEEKYMKTINYPYLEEHKKLHRILFLSMLKIIKNSKTTNALKESLYIAIKEWLLGHIILEDIKIENYNKFENNNLLSNIIKENKQLEKTNIFFLYTCQCVNKIHKVPLKIHNKIQNNANKYICKICQKTLKADQ